MINSRFYSFPDTGSTVDSMVNNWRTDDFHLKDSTASLDSLSSSSNSPRRYSTVNIKDTSKAAVARNNARLEKHRNLAAHLVNYSASTDFYKAHMNLSSVQTFLNICDTDDPRIVSNCVIAISNIAAFENVRSLLFEINAVHKFTNLVTNIKGKQAAWAASLLFYYFSCDTETEDRVYTAGTAFLVLAGMWQWL